MHAEHPSKTRVKGEQRRLHFQPALEGLRGLSVLGILLFHSNFEWAAGGFLGVSTFFTLSGFLIMSLFLVEHDRFARIDLLAFWSRRFRRLMPASLITLAAIALFGAGIEAPDQLGRLRGDILWALAYLGNWRFIFSEAAYAQLFTEPSAVLHFWSLGIEEQLYLAFPIAVTIAFAVARGSRAALAGSIGMLVAGSLAATLVLWQMDVARDRIYYGTDTRAAELLIGALLALWLANRSLGAAGARCVKALGTAALLAVLALWVLWDLESGVLYRGGLPAYALLSSAVIAAAVQPSGAVRSVLSWRWIRRLGRISYGVYLYHWPIYLWLTSERTGLGEAQLFALRVALTVGIAILSYDRIEAPIRERRILVGRRAFHAAASLACAIVVGTTLLPAGPRGDSIDFAESLAVERSTSGDVPANDLPTRHRATPRLAVFGDSTALQLDRGLRRWGSESEEAEVLAGWTGLGCGVARAGRYRYRMRERSAPAACRDRDRNWEDRLDAVRPDIAVVLVGPWEVSDRKLPGDDAWRKPGDPIFDDYLRNEMLAAVDVLASGGGPGRLADPSFDRDSRCGQAPRDSVCRLRPVAHGPLQ